MAVAAQQSSFDYVDDMLAFENFGPLAVSLWRGPVGPKQADLLQKRWLALAKEHPKIGILSVVRAKCKPPSSEIRARLQAVFADLGGSLAGVGVVLEGGDMLTAAARLFVSGAAVFAKATCPIRTFSTADPAVEWLLEALGDRNSTARVLERIRRERDHFFS